MYTSVSNRKVGKLLKHIKNMMMHLKYDAIFNVHDLIDQFWLQPKVEMLKARNWILNKRDMQGMGCWKYEEKYFPLDGVIPNQTGYLVKGINVHQCLQQEGGKTVEAHQKYDDAPQVWCNIQCTWSYRPILVATQSRDAEGTQLDTEQEKHMEV